MLYRVHKSTLQIQIQIQSKWNRWVCRRLSTLTDHPWVFEDDKTSAKFYFLNNIIIIIIEAVKGLCGVIRAIQKVVPDILLFQIPPLFHKQYICMKGNWKVN